MVRSSIFFLISIMLCTINILVPVDAGLPRIHIFTAPFSISAIVTWACFLFLLLLTKGQALSLLKNSFPISISFLLSLFCLISVFVANTSFSLLYTFNLVTIYVIMYLVVKTIWDLGGRNIFLSVFNCTVGIAAVIGILEGFGYTLPIYNYINRLYWQSRGIEFITSGTTFDFRVIGTMGNTIVFSTLMMFSLPIIFSINNRLVKYALVSLVLSAASLTLSRTIYLFLVCYLFGYIFIHNFTIGRKQLLLFSVILFGLFISFSDNTIVNRWQQRFLEEKELKAAGGVPLRLILLTNAFNSVLDADAEPFFVGNGYGSSISAAEHITDNLTTFDNVYVTILYENGLIGFLLFSWLLIRGFYYVYRHSRSSYLFYSLIGYVLCGMSFATHVYFTINFIFIIIVVLAVSNIHSSSSQSSESSYGTV